MEQALFETGDICRTRHGGNVASEKANARVRKNTDNAAILTIFKRRFQMSSADLEVELGRPKNKWSGRLTWLKQHGYIYDTGSRDAEGCSVLRITQKGIEVFDTELKN